MNEATRSRRGLDAAFGGKRTRHNGQAFRMREYCNPFHTYKAYGKEFWGRRIAEIAVTDMVGHAAGSPV